MPPKTCHLERISVQGSHPVNSAHIANQSIYLVLGTVHALTLNRCVRRPVFPVGRLGMSVICKMWQMDSGAAPLFFGISQAKLVQRYSDVTCSTFYPVGGRTYRTLLYFGILENHQGQAWRNEQSRIVERQPCGSGPSIISRSVRGGGSTLVFPPPRINLRGP